MLANKILFVDEKLLYYGDLFNRITNDTEVYTIWKYPSVSEYVINLTKALYYEKDIILVDNDFSTQELFSMGYDSPFERTEKIISVPFVSDESFINRILSSRSKITLFTSGTTGLPKKVSHNINSLARMVRRASNYEADVWALAYNPTHMAGIQVLLQGLLNFNTIVNVFNKELRSVYQLMESYKVTHISATPTFYRINVVPSKEVCPSVKRVTVGGEKYDESLRNYLVAKFPNAKINNIYASTEIGSLLVSANNVFKIPVSLQTKVKIENNQLVVHNSLLGEVSKNIDEWYHTGDIVEMNEEGDGFKFVRRENDMVNIGGYKVNPAEVEEALMNISGISAAIVYGKDNSVMGKMLYAEVVSEEKVDVKLIRQKLEGVLQDFKIPRIIRQVNDINTTRTGKIKRTI